MLSSKSFGFTNRRITLLLRCTNTSDQDYTNLFTIKYPILDVININIITDIFIVYYIDFFLINFTNIYIKGINITILFFSWVVNLEN